jgi:hypothetical protein
MSSSSPAPMKHQNAATRSSSEPKYQAIAPSRNMAPMAVSSSGIAIT